MALQQNRPYPEGRNEQQIQEALRLTPQEIKVIKECTREAVYKRSLPTAAVFGTAAYSLCEAGILKKHPRWGPRGKIGFGMFLGYWVGKISYSKTCLSRLLDVPGGTYAAKYGKNQANSEMLDPGFTSLDTSTTPASQIIDEPHSSLNLDLESVHVSEPEFTRPYTEDFTFNESKLNEPLLYSPPVTSYEELRRQNREQYETAQRNLISQSPSNRPYRPPSSSVLLEPEERPVRKRKNEYGDDMEN